jgi:hypothetical protein
MNYSLSKEKDTDNFDKHVKELPFVDNVAETGIFSAFSTIKPITMRNPINSSTDNQASTSGAGGNAKSEGEVFEP